MSFIGYTPFIFYCVTYAYRLVINFGEQFIEPIAGLLDDDVPFEAVFIEFGGQL
jgi:hypothetical protein